MYPCKTCGIEKPADQYYIQKIRGEPYRQKHCKPCHLRSEKRRRINQTPEQKAAVNARKKRREVANAERMLALVEYLRRHEGDQA